MKKWFKKHKKGTIILSVVVVAAIAGSGDPSENIAKGEGINSENAGKAKHHTII